MFDYKKILKDNLYFIIFIIFSAGMAGFFITYAFVLDSNGLVQIKNNIKREPVSIRVLDGLEVAKDETDLRPIMIMLENHFESRPIAGLEQASIIYETIVEGDITRFLAIFDPTSTAKKIGPVRSVRPFFVELAQEWNGVYFHAGGSPEGLKILKESTLDSVNEISADGIYFWRDSNKSAPHNLYTSMDQMKRSIFAKGFATSTDFIAWEFKQPQATSDEVVPDVEVNFSSHSLYQVRYVYNAIDNNYTRYQDEKVHKTATGIILKADNIIKQYVDSEIIDYYGRLSIDLDSGGLAEIYLDGREISGSWEKVDGRTVFYNESGETVKLNPGVTWVELLFN